MRWTGWVAGLVAAFTLGWSWGVMTSTRINTVAAMAYVNSLDLEKEAGYRVQLARELAARDQELETFLLKQDAVVRQAQTDARLAAEAYSAEIASLRTQLAAHGLQPRILKVVQ